MEYLQGVCRFYIDSEFKKCYTKKYMMPGVAAAFPAIFMNLRRLL